MAVRVAKGAGLECSQSSFGSVYAAVLRRVTCVASVVAHGEAVRHDQRMPMTNAEAHQVAREKGVSGPFYLVVKTVVGIVFRLLCGFTVRGKENVPKKGPIVIVPNHKSFWDPFFVALVLRRPVHFMGKAEYAEGRFARPFLALGYFPVRRGESDAEALETARQILARGDALALFPEGTRVRGDDLGTPKRGAARLAIEAGAPLVPATITGTEKRKWPLPRKVTLTFGEPVSVADLEATPEDAAEAIGRAWPQVAEEYTRWQNRPGAIAAGAAALGVGAWIIRRRMR